MRPSPTPLLLAVALVGPLGAAGQQAKAKAPASKAARAVAAVDRKLAALLAEGTGFELRQRYEALLAQASAVARTHAADPASARAYLVIARCCEVLGKHPEKEAAFAHYIDALVAHSRPEAARELRREVEALVARRELYTAGKILRLMLSKFPEGDQAAYALYRLGTCHLWMEQYDEAASALAEVVERWPKADVAVEAHLRLARANLSQGKSAESIGPLEACLAEHPKSPHRIPLLFDLAIARYLSADHYGALVGFQRILREAPRSPYAPLAQTCLDKLRAEVLQRITN